MNRQESKAKRPSMVDVARHAGVAVVTVSRVLNEPTAVRPATRAKIEQAMDELGYRVNTAARELRSGSSSAIGILIAGSSIFELSRVLDGISQSSRIANQTLSVSLSPSGSKAEFEASARELTDRGIAALIIIADRSAAFEAIENYLPIVPTVAIMSGDTGNPHVSSVEIDQVEGARLATEHLVELGHTRIAHFAGPPTIFDANARSQGWHEAMNANGLSTALEYRGELTASSGHSLALDALSSPTAPTAIFAANDRIALGIVSAAAELDLVIPRDLALVGFDNMDGSEYFLPPLSTVEQDQRQLGSTAMKLLDELLEGSNPRHALITPGLIVRASSHRN